MTEDIPVLADAFLKMYAGKTEQSVKRLDASAIKALKQHLWIGNVRELKNVIIQAAFGTDSDVITSSDLTFNVSDPEDYEDVHLKNPSDEKRRITDALSRTGWNKFQAAKLLKISRTTLDYKIRQFGINKDEV